MFFKLMFTTTKADSFPVQLELMRNYQLPLSEKENNDMGFTNPKGNIYIIYMLQP